MSGHSSIHEVKRQAAVSRITRTLLLAILLANLQLSFAPIFAPQVFTAPAQATTPEMIQSGLALDINSSNATDRGNLSSGGSPAYTSTGGGYYTLSSASSQYLMNSTTPVTQGAGNKFSVFMWVYPTAAGQLLSHLGQAQINASYHTSIIDYTNSDQMVFGVWNGSDQSYVTSTISTPKNNWYHIGFVYNGTRITAYINGASAGTTSNFTFDPPANSYFGIGAYDGTTMVQGASYGNMRFGSLSVYNRELTGSEVSTNFSATTGRFGPTVSNPSNASAFTNRTATFSSSACSNITSGSATCNYQWQLSTDAGTTWNFISGATSNTYTTPVLTSSYNGYRYRLYAWDPGTGVTTASDLYTVTSAATLTVATLPGTDTDTAVNTSNNRFFYAPNANSILPGTLSTLTMEAWIKPSATCDGNYYCSVFASNNSVFLSVYQSKISYVIGSGAAWCSGGAVTQVSKVVPSGSWTHIAMVRNSANVKIYINGGLVSNLDSSCSPTTMTAPSGQQFGIGYRHTLDQFFYGSIDEARIWTSDRSASIGSDMHSNETSTANLIGYWNFNEGSGETAYNQVPAAESSSDLISYGSDKSNPAFWDSASISDETITSAYSARTFYRSYITAKNGWKVPSGVSRVSALVVGGGGGGGDSTASATGGGGGAGGFFQNGNIYVAGFLPVGVGTGGNGSTLTTQGIDGGTSYLGTLKVGGGGGGNGYNYAGGSRAKAGVGGSDFVSGGSGGGGRPTGAGVGNENLGGLAGSFAASGISFLGSTYTGFQGAAGGANSDGASGGWGGTILQANRTSSFSGSSVIYSKVSTYVTWESSGNVKTPGSGGSPNYGYGTDPTVGGGDGAAGIIVLRWITASAPIYTPPVSDTLTAGMVETFTVTGTPNSPLTRGYRWQVSSDTGTTWVNASTGTGFTSANYVTPILETTTSGIRYQYRVVVTDSDTAGLSIVETSTAVVFLTINPRITITGSSLSLTQKYGETQTVTYTIANGTGTRTTAASPNNRTGITWSSVSGNSATLGIGTGLGFGTYYETLTVTDSVTATTTQIITISISKADTITVTNSVVTMTYSGAQATSGYTITGLKNSETATATVNYSGISPTVLASTSTAPTNAGNYRATPSAIVLSAGASVNNYQSVVYESATVTINKANQARLTIGQYDAYPGVSTYPVNVYGGTGLGAVTRSLVTTGTANCTLTNAMFLTATTQGTCSVRAVKSGGINYFDETTTATTYWITFRTNYANGAAGGSTGITLTGETAITKLTYETFTVLSFANGSGSAITNASVGSVLRVIGTGFNASDSTTEVFFGMTSVPASSLTFNVVDPLANYVQLTVPVDAETDRVVMRSRKGWATSPGTLTITP